MGMFAEKTLEILRRYVQECHGGFVLRASKALGVPNDTLDRWVNGTRDPKLSKIGPLIDKILWEHSEPKKIGVLEVKFPEIQSAGKCSEAECRRLREELQTANERIADLEKELFASERLNRELKDMIDKRLDKAQEMPAESRQNKSSA